MSRRPLTAVRAFSLPLAVCRALDALPPGSRSHFVSRALAGALERVRGVSPHTASGAEEGGLLTALEANAGGVPSSTCDPGRGPDPGGL